MPEPGENSRSSGGYVVLREIEDGHWHVVGDVFACVPRSEWRVARQLWPRPPVRS